MKAAGMHWLAGTAFEALPKWTAAFALLFYGAFAVWSAVPLTAQKRPKLRATFSSCCISLLHGIVTTVLSAHEIAHAWPLDIAAPNTARQSFLLLFSTAYMIIDLVCFLLPFTPQDALFIGHHCMTAGYMVSSLALGRGGISVMVLMALGESTSVLQNAWYIARDLRRDSKAAMTAFRRLSPIYSLVFVLVRTCVGPPAILWLAKRILQASDIPAALRYFWAACGVLGVTGSQLWTYKLVRGWRKHMRSEAAAGSNGSRVKAQ